MGGNGGPSFNSRSRGGSDTIPKADKLACGVSIHAPAGGATEEIPMGGRGYGVSIHAPAGGATGDWRERGECGAVSIHAPAGGATHGTGEEIAEAVVSIHAPAGGATLPPSVTSQSSFSFNSRSRGGSDWR